MSRCAVATILNIVPYAMLTPQVVVRMAEAGAAAKTVALYGLAPFAAILCASAVAPRLMRRFGLEAAHLAGLVGATAALTATAMSLMWGWLRVDAHLAFALLLGASTALTWTATEAMIAAHAAPARLGAATASYQTGLGLAFALGPFLPVVFALDGSGMAIATGAFMGAALLIGFAGAAGPARDARPARAELNGRPAWPALIFVAAAAFLGGVFELGLNAIIAYHGLTLGMTADAGAAIVGVIALGALLAQIPIGLMRGDARGRTAHRFALSGLCLGALVAFTAEFEATLLWPAALIFGAGGGALYTIAMIEVGRSGGDGVASLTAAAVFAYTLGAVLGPLGSGAALDAGGGALLWTALGVSSALFLLLSFTRFARPNSET